MSKKIETIKKILRIPLWKLPYPRILFTVDSSEPKYESEIAPLLEKFAAHQVPVTLFVSNETLSGQGNYSAIQEIFRFSERNRLPLEIASHGFRHYDLSNADPCAVIEKINESVSDFDRKGVDVRGFRAPFLSIEEKYRDILSAMRGNNGGVRYDSSTCFESSLLTSFFHILVRKKCPHKIGAMWELPISALDDYHILQKKGRGERFAYFYWVAEANIWIRRLNYCMLLFHPYIIGKNLVLLDKLLSYCRDRFPPECFMTCVQLVNELDALCIHTVLPGSDQQEARA